MCLLELLGLSTQLVERFGILSQQQVQPSEVADGSAGGFLPYGVPKGLAKRDVLLAPGFLNINAA